MKKIIGIILFLSTLCTFSFALENILIDDFNSKSLKSPVEWWAFDCKPDISQGALTFKGQVNNWYYGGVGTYIAKGDQDLSQNTAIKMDIIGNGPDSGKLKIELYDDDNGNWQIEQDPSKGYIPIYDDRFVYEQKIDWSGLKTIIIPFSNFVDDNPGIGNDKWDIGQSNGSGGLLQMQLISLGNKADGNVNFSIDNISLIKE